MIDWSRLVYEQSYKQQDLQYTGLCHRINSPTVEQDQRFVGLKTAEKGLVWLSTRNVGLSILSVGISGCRTIACKNIEVTPKNCTICYNNESASFQNKEVEQVKPIQMNIYQRNTNKKVLNWLQSEPKVQEKQQVKDHQSCITIFVAYPASQSSSHEHSPDMTTIPHAWSYGRFIKIQSNLRGKKLHRTNQTSNFLGGSFSDKDNVRAPIQFGRESQQQHLKR